MNNETSTLARKYRPLTLDKIIGQELAVTRLRGIIKSGKVSNTMLLVGPSSAGKTTLARAFTAELFGTTNLDAHPDYMEINAAETRGIDDVRSMLNVAKLRPRKAPYRVILIDEVHGVTGQAENALLKPLEEPPPKTVFILGTMEPEKLKQAVRNRGATTINLSAPEKEDVEKFVKRVVKGEEMKFLTKEHVTQIVEASNAEFRSAANILEAIQQAHAGGGDVMIEKVLKSTTTEDEKLVAATLGAIYGQDVPALIRTLMDVKDSVRFMQLLLNANRFVMNASVLGNETHRAVWWTPLHKAVLKDLKEIATQNQWKSKAMLSKVAVVHRHLTETRAMQGTFMLNDADLLVSRFIQAVEDMK